MNILLARVYDESARVVITEENFGELQRLSEELGFSGLDTELRAFEGLASDVSVKRYILALEERVNDLYRQNKAILKLLKIHQELVGKRVHTLEEFVTDTRKGNTELQEAVTREVQFVKKKLDESSRESGKRTLVASKEMNLALEKCSKRVDELTRDVAQLKEIENKQQKQIPDLTGDKLEDQQVSLQRQDFVCTRSSKLDGIINYLTRTCGGNVHDAGVVCVTSSSVFNSYHPKNAVDLGINSYYKSKNGTCEWI